MDNVELTALRFLAAASQLSQVPSPQENALDLLGPAAKGQCCPVQQAKHLMLFPVIVEDSLLLSPVKPLRPLEPRSTA